MTRFYCCEICDRNPTCGVDCGSCEPELEKAAACYVHVYAAACEIAAAAQPAAQSEGKAP